MAAPNILFIATDDMCHLSGMLKRLITGFTMPNLEALMASGTDFNRGYCAVPICEPARCAMMTGLSPAATKSFDFAAGWKDIVRPEHLWTYRLREAGYYMVTQGKIFHGYPAQPQWVYNALYDDSPFNFSPYYPETPRKDWGGITLGGFTSGGWDDQDEEFYDYKMASRTISFLNSYDGERPFYCESGFMLPHNPYYAPNRCFEAVPLENVHIEDEWNAVWQTSAFADKFVRQFGNYIAQGNNDPTTWSEEEKTLARVSIRNYAAGALFMDEQLGRIISALENSPHASNTIVTFYSDHGYHIADHNRWHKFTLYEQAARAPMLIKVPGQTPRVVNTPVSHLDIGATLLDYAGIEKPLDHRGVSLRRFIEGDPSATHDPVPTFWYGSVSLIDSDLKRTTLYSDGSAEMYDVDADPWGKVNIAATDPDFSDKRDLAIATAYDWGLMIVEQAIDVSRPSHLQSFLGTDITDVPIPTSIVALGDMNEKGRSPWHNLQYRQAMQENQVMKMPAHIKDYRLMGVIPSVTKYTLIANDEDNNVSTSGWGVVATIDLGGGDDVYTAAQGRITVYGMDGNDRIRLGNSNGSIGYGGTGNDTITGGSGNDLIYGDEGDDSLSGGAGNDTIYGGPGNDIMNGGTGDDVIHLDGGADTVNAGAGYNTLIVYRTGQMSTIANLGTNDTVDLSAWAPLGPVTLEDVDDGVIARVGMERLLFRGHGIGWVTPRITGVELA